MAATLDHRGPDGEGFAIRGRCALGFRRLAIIDLGAPAEPFSNEDGSVWSVCNGQIYNSAEVDADLRSKGHRFRTRVDTEILPHMYEEHGVELWSLLNGMFTAAIWDENREVLVLGRDRAGEKPLFYWRDDQELVFASELRALLVHPRVRKDLNPVALHRYLTHDYFPAPLTPFAGISKLPAGHTLVVERGQPVVRRYWNLIPYFDQPDIRNRSERDLCHELDERIGRAVRRRRRSDTPVGLFLSGGIDSTTLLAYFTEQFGRGVPVFSIGHEDRNFDESEFAGETARHFGAEFHPLILGERDLADGLRRVARGFDEPLGDASIIPTHLLSLFARQHVKVILSGEGADEMFAGYPTYIGNRVADGFMRIPPSLRSGLIKLARRIAPVSMGNVGVDYLLEQFVANAQKTRIERHHSWFGSFGGDNLDRILSAPLVERLRDDDPFAGRPDAASFPDALAELLYTDFTMYLQDDLLTKIDRASMLASLETRAPFLDHELVEFVAGLPSRMKLRGLTTKAILRKTVRNKIPRAVLTRRKRGFNIPFSRWLLSGLGTELRERFAPDRVAGRGLLNAAGVQNLLDEHMSRRHDHRKRLFTLLMLDLWCDRTYGEGSAVPIAGDDF